MQHTYGGGDPAAWLDRPVSLLRALAAALPRLAAEESLSRVSSAVVAAGRGTEQLRAWERAAAPPAPRRRAAPAAVLAGAGIAVVRGDQGAAQSRAERGGET